MAHVGKKTAAGSWPLYWREHGKQRQRNFVLKKDADRVCLEINRKTTLSPFGAFELEATTMTATELYDDWMRFHVEPNLGVNTARSYRATWSANLEERIGELDVRRLTPAYLADLAAQLKAAGVGKAAQAKTLAVLSGMLRRAVVKGLLEYHPMRGAVKVPQPKRERSVEAPGPEQIWTIADRLEAAKDDDGRTLELLLGFAGLRPEEALGLDWRNVGKRTLNIEQVAINGEIVPTTKNGRRRSVTLQPALERELVSYRLRRGLPDKGLVLGDEHGKPWKDHDYRNWRARVFKTAAAGITTRPYDLRHAYASLLFHEGKSVIEVAAELGHSASVCLDTYGHVIGELAGAKRRVKASTAIEKARKATRGSAAGSTLARGEGGE